MKKAQSPEKTDVAGNEAISGPAEPELTVKAVLAGVVMALVFGAANAYLGMKAGQTVSATIPAAVIGVALFRLPFYRGGILEQNIARTAASVGEALAAGAVFTIPAFLLVNVGGQHFGKTSARIFGRRVSF